MNSYVELLSQIMANGDTTYPRGQEIKELMHVKLHIEKANIYSFPEVRDLNKIMDYATKELAWYLSGDRSPEYIQNKAKLWAKITNPDNTLNSNYGHLVFYNNTHHPSLGGITFKPFEWAYFSLLKDKDSRQAIITYNTGGFNFDGNQDYICTQHQAFFIRNNKLVCFIALRSSDAIWGLPYNKIWWSIVHQNLYLMLKPIYPELKLGAIEVDIYSAHIYQKHYELVEKMLATNYEKYFIELKSPIVLERSIEEYLEIIPKITELKKV